MAYIDCNPIVRSWCRAAELKTNMVNLGELCVHNLCLQNKATYNDLIIILR